MLGHAPLHPPTLSVFTFSFLDPLALFLIHAFSNPLTLSTSGLGTLPPHLTLPRLVRYCREDCQTQDWSCHQEFCRREDRKRQHLIQEKQRRKEMEQEEVQEQDGGKIEVINMMEVD